MKCHVLIPVGPGHDELVARAVESVRIATENNQGPFDEIRIRMLNDTEGELGRSAARNEMVGSSDADWVFFLDADDLMHPDAFLNFGCIDVDTIAAWGEILEYTEGVVSPRYQVPRIDSYEALIGYDAYLTLQMGHFVRRDVAARYPFNAEMDVGEDWDYYLRLWSDKRLRCQKLDLPFMINCRGNHSTGPRSATGVDWRNVVDPMLEKARAELEPKIQVAS